MPRALFEPRPDRPLAFHAASVSMAFDAPPENAAFEQCGTAGVVTIRGPLVQHGSLYCFWDSFDAIVQRVEAACASSSVRDIVLKIDSPGGDALGCFEAARCIRKAAEAAGKKIYAYCDGLIASAAYALASAASGGIFVPLAGAVGSIGVLIQVIDATQQDAAMGLRFAMISSGARKLDGNPHVALTKEAVTEIQGKCDALATLFFDFVAEMRPTITADAVRALQADTFFGAKAVEVGIADGVAEWSEFLAMVAKGTFETATPGSQKATANTESKTMASKMSKELRAGLSEMAKGDSEEAAQARALLAMHPEEDGEKKEGEGGEKKEGAKAELPEEKKETKAEEKKEMKASSEDDSKAVAMAATARVHALELKLQAKEEADERAVLLAQRPDFSAAVVATLKTMPLSYLREAVEKWEKPAGFPAAAALVQGTAGKTQNGSGASVSTATPAEASYIAKMMGGGPTSEGVKHEGSSMTLGFMTPEDAQKRVAELAAGKAAAR